MGHGDFCCEVVWWQDRLYHGHGSGEQALFVGSIHREQGAGQPSDHGQSGSDSRFAPWISGTGAAAGMSAVFLWEQGGAVRGGAKGREEVCQGQQYKTGGKGRVSPVHQISKESLPMVSQGSGGSGHSVSGTGGGCCSGGNAGGKGSLWAGAWGDWGRGDEDTHAGIPGGHICADGHRASRRRAQKASCSSGRQWDRCCKAQEAEEIGSVGVWDHPLSPAGPQRARGGAVFSGIFAGSEFGHGISFAPAFPEGLWGQSGGSGGQLHRGAAETEELP